MTTNEPELWGWASVRVPRNVVIPQISEIPALLRGWPWGWTPSPASSPWYIFEQDYVSWIRNMDSFTSETLSEKQTCWLLSLKSKCPSMGLRWSYFTWSRSRESPALLKPNVLAVRCHACRLDVSRETCFGSMGNTWTGAALVTGPHLGEVTWQQLRHCFRMFLSFRYKWNQISLYHKVEFLLLTLATRRSTLKSADSSFQTFPSTGLRCNSLLMPHFNAFFLSEQELKISLSGPKADLGYLKPDSTNALSSLWLQLHRNCL